VQGKFIYICRTDTDRLEQGRYVQSTRRVFPSREKAEYAAAGVAASRNAVVVELPEPVEVDEHFYPM